MPDITPALERIDMILRLGRRKSARPLERRLGYVFRDSALLETALVHRSFRFEKRHAAADNQRMEFLGDAVLGLVAGARIYALFPDQDEGALTEHRSRVTSGRALARIARGLDLGAEIRLGRGEEQSGGRSRDSVLADTLEAVLGAVYLDGGLKAVERVFDRHFTPLLEAAEAFPWAQNPKGTLQSLAQRAHRQPPVYRCVEVTGPAHDRRFVVEVLVAGMVIGRGSGKSRREAEQEAAREAMKGISSGDAKRADS